MDIASKNTNKKPFKSLVSAINHSFHYLVDAYTCLGSQGFWEECKSQVQIVDGQKELHVKEEMLPGSGLRSQELCYVSFINLPFFTNLPD